MTDYQIEVDARNLSCPVPVKKTKQALTAMAAGEVLHVITTDAASVEDINILLKSMEDEMIEKTECDGEYHFYIKKA